MTSRRKFLKATAISSSIVEHIVKINPVKYKTIQAAFGVLKKKGEYGV